MGETFHVGKIAIVGAGLIGGSILKACVERGLADRIAVYDAHAETRASITREGGKEVALADSPERAVEGAAIVLLCVPARQLPSLVPQIIPQLTPKAIVTDVCSVKGRLVREIDELLAGKAHWIGGHPMAGREQSGFAMADADLFVGRQTILTPTQRTWKEALQAITSFWQALGATVIEKTPEVHDRLVADVSHLPHLATFVLAQAVSPESLEVAGPGFRDTTRIAASSADLWQEILLSNQEEILPALDRFLADLQKARAALAANDETALHEILKRANDMRRKLDAPSS